MSHVINTSRLYKFHISEQHPFHLVNPSPWPLYVSFNAFQFTTSFVLYMNKFDYSFFILCFSFLTLLFTISRWFTDVVVESTFEGHHTSAVRRGLSLGMILFIVSEIMFFFSFFWAFFHFSLTPAIAIGSVWPPKNLEPLNPFHIPLLNTVLLLSSGVSITYAHRAIVGGSRGHTTFGLILTILYGIIFTGFQGYEYVTAPFSINDSVYGSVFYMATGFHGFHVLIGTIFLIFCLLRHLNYHFDVSQHVGFEAAAWYWHFVDVVWLFLYITIYVWGDYGSVLYTKFLGLQRYYNSFFYITH
jgi:cytochrome c oxidase subunit 3